jgi:thiamine-phosphate diphosphorylase
LRRVPVPCLALVTDAARFRDRPLGEVVSAAVRGGVDLVQLRVRQEGSGPKDVLRIAQEIRRAIGNDALLFINGYPEVAVESGADGVHLPEADEDVARADLPPGLLIGRSVHSASAAKKAQRAGADLLLAGAMFLTPSHPGIKPSGPGLVSDIKRSAPPGVIGPVIGIGGIDPDNAGLVMDAGADGVAVIGAIWGSADPEAAARQLRASIDQRRESD